MNLKRDFELIRKILVKIEEYPHFGHITDFKIEGVDEDALNYHLLLLKEANYIKANLIELGSGKYILSSVQRLTFDGHEFLDSLKNKELWNQFVEYLKGESKELGSLPISVLLELFKKFAINWGETKLGFNNQSK